MVLLIMPTVTYLYDTPYLEQVICNKVFLETIDFQEVCCFYKIG